MEVSPKTLREVEFREKMRGYHPEDVDHFLEQVAAGIEVLQDRLRQAVERAQRAEAVASDSSGTDETLRKTLVLAQRTADMAVQEAREQAARILASAEQQAQAILSEAEERGRHTLEDTIAECKAELGRLEATRSQSQQEVESLQRWLDEHKAHLQASLADAMAAVERAGVLWPAPSTRPVEVPGVATSSKPPTPAQALAPGGIGGSSGAEDAAHVTGPDTMTWSPSDDDRFDPPASPAGHESGGAIGSRADDVDEVIDLDADDRALDDFFDDPEDYADDRRFSGRLRRRR